MGADYKLESFTYYPRPGAGNGTIDLLDFYVVKEWPDETDVSFWEDPANWGEPVVNDQVFDWSNYGGGGQTVTLDPEVADGRYFVFYALSEKNDNPWASCGEITLKGQPSVPTRIKADHRDIEVMIFPNPNTGSFRIKTDKADVNIRIYNTAGALVYGKNGVSGSEQINIDTKGVYLINIESDGNSLTKKLIIR
jgi:hypothetical protein